MRPFPGDQGDYMDEIIQNRTLVDAISFRRERDPQGLAFVFLSGDGQDRAVGNDRFYNDMKQCAMGLVSRGIRQGEIVLLALGHDYELITCFWGTMCCGAIPSVLTYWRPGSDMDVYARKIERLAAAVQARAVITLPELYPSLHAALANMGCLVFTARDLATVSADMTRSLPVVEAGQIALMQFTSGTTSTPKGIQFPHRAILDNIAANARAYRMTREFIYVSWLPFYHDMGLISHIRSLVHGGLFVTMAPQTWLQRPEMLLQAIHRYRGTMTNMPNFSFDYCTQRIRDEDLAGVDLSSWRILTNGSEQVMPDSMNRFSERFARYGFRTEALSVGYGMAENVCGISVTSPGQGLSVDWVSADGLHVQNRALPVEAGSAGARAVASCGYPFRGIDLAILDDQWTHMPERGVGEIAIRSNSLFSGYFRAPEASEGTFRDGWFRTGDIGYVADGQLYVCDRKKDLIIYGGRNVHPHAIENIAAGVFGQYAARCAAFGVSEPQMGTEIPVLLVERRKQLDDAGEQQLIRRVHQLVYDELEINLADVRMVPRGWVEKTTSGKVARAANRRKYLDEYRAPAPQETRLSPDELTPARVLHMVTHLFEIVLGTGGIGPDDDFVNLGGDSLSALRLFIEIEERFGQKIPAAEFFRQPTAGHLATLLCRRMNGDAAAETETPPWLAGGKHQLHQGTKPRSLLLINIVLEKIKGPLGRMAFDFTGKAGLPFLTWLYGQRWAQRIVKRDIVHSLRRFYALLEDPSQNEAEAVQCGLLVSENPGAIRKQLSKEIFSHKQGGWSLQVDVARLKRAYQGGRGVIVVGRHAGQLTRLVTKHAKECVKPNGYSFIGNVAGFLPEGVEAFPKMERWRLKFPIYLDQLLHGIRTLTQGGIVLTLPDGHDGLSRGISLPFHGRMCSFKAGFAELAIETGASVVPVSLAVDFRKKRAHVLFLEPLDNGPADMDPPAHIEGLVRQYTAFLKDEWNRCPGIVPLRLKKLHLDSPPLEVIE
jgi:fatty-acyl-CoA synthase